MAVAEGTGLYEPYRLNRAKKRPCEEGREPGCEIKTGDTQEMKNKAVERNENTGNGNFYTAGEKVKQASRNSVWADTYDSKATTFTKRAAAGVNSENRSDFVL